MSKRKIKKFDLEKKRFLFFQIGLLTALAVTFFAFEWKTYNYNLMEDEKIFDSSNERVEILPPVTRVKKKIEKPKEVRKKKNPDKIVIIPNHTPIVIDTVIDVIEPIDSVLTWIPVDPEPFVEPDPLFIAEIMPEFDGGIAAMHQYLIDNIKYPQRDRENKITGTVYVQFVIDVDGSVANAQILRGATEGMNNESLRVINSMPKWSPGVQNGHKVKVLQTIPINYKLKDN